MSETIREMIEREAAALTVPLPLVHFGPRVLSDALQTAGFFDRYYEPSVEGAQPVPGFRDTGLPATLGQEIRLLVDDIGVLNNRLLAAGAGYPATPLRALVTRGHALLRWRARREPALDPSLRALLRKHAGLRRAGPLAIALGDLLRLVPDDADRLRALQALDGAFFTQADEALRAFDDWQPPDLTPAFTQRARLAVLLQARVSDIHATADVVFHGFPHLKRKARGDGVLLAAAASGRVRRKRRDGASEEPVRPAEV